MVINTARKLNMSERKFYNTQDVVLTKLYYIIFR